MPEPVVLERTYTAPLGRVWDAWTRDDEVARWYCPNPALDTRARLDVRRGGTHEVDMGPAFALRGVYSDVVDGERLAHTWAFDGGHETHVEVRFATAPGGTAIVVTHDGFEDDDERDGIEQGWQVTLGRLADLLREEADERQA